ncbi:unnamed protein product [Prunus armeniaca]
MSAPTIMPTISKSTTNMVQAASLGSAVTVDVAFLTPPPLFDLQSQALPSGEDRLLSRDLGLVGYSVIGTVNLSDVVFLLDKPMETDPVESPGRLP